MGLHPVGTKNITAVETNTGSAAKKRVGTRLIKRIAGARVPEGSGAAFGLAGKGFRSSLFLRENTASETFEAPAAATCLRTGARSR